jgi:uncharacterized protein YhfF
MFSTAVATCARGPFSSVLEWNYCGKRIVMGCPVEAPGAMKADIPEFWQGYLAGLQPSHSDRQPEPDSVFSFGDSSEMADQMAILVRQGIKTATCSALSTYEEDQTSLPQKGNLSVVLDGSGFPVCIIETLEAFVASFNEVSERFAYEEGEGDRSLAYWRKAHRNFFSRHCSKNRVFDERMLLVCERFKLVYASRAEL